MKKLFTLFGLIIKQHIRNPFFLAILLALPVSALALCANNSKTAGMEVRIGIYTEESNEFISDIFEFLQKNDGIATFIPYDHFDELELQIKKNELACGYIFRSGLQDKLNSGKYTGAIRLLSGPQSQIAASLSNEIIFSAILQCNGEEFINQFLKGNSLTAPYEAYAKDLIHETLVTFQTNNSTYHVEFESLGESDNISDTIPLPSGDSLFPLHNALLLLIFAAGLLGSLQYLQEYSRRIFSPMPVSCRIAAIFLYPFVLSLLTGVAALLTLYCFEHTMSAQTILQMLVYTFLVSIYCGVLSRIIPSQIFYAAMIPVILMVCLVIYPIFINLEPFVPGIAFLRKIFPPAYMI